MSEKPYKPELFRGVIVEDAIAGHQPVYCLETDITLRDLFAAAALTGLIAADIRAGLKAHEVLPAHVRVAFDFSDLMLAEREKAREGV